MKKSTIYSVTLLMMLAGVAQAGEVSSVQSATPAVVGTQGQLDALNAENALLQVELKNLQLKEQIKNGGKEAGSTSAPILPTGSKASFYDDMPDAKVVLVSGEPGHAIATIIVNGATIKAGAGKLIRGLGMVKSVSLDEVIIQTKKTEFALPFVADTLSAPSGSPGGMSIPPLPAMPSPMGVR